MTTVELVERLVVLERLMIEEMVKGLPDDYLRGVVEGKRDTYRQVLGMITGVEPSKPVLVTVTREWFRPAHHERKDKPQLKCLRCGREWTPRMPRMPKTCAKYNSPYWNKVRLRSPQEERKIPPKTP